jgi:hypothetical protein
MNDGRYIRLFVTLADSAVKVPALLVGQQVVTRLAERLPGTFHGAASAFDAGKLVHHIARQAFGAHFERLAAESFCLILRLFWRMNIRHAPQVPHVQGFTIIDRRRGRRWSVFMGWCSFRRCGRRLKQLVYFKAPAWFGVVSFFLNGLGIIAFTTPVAANGAGEFCLIDPATPPAITRT